MNHLSHKVFVSCDLFHSIIVTQSFHTIFSHTPLLPYSNTICHTRSFTHHFATHLLSHTTLTPTIFYAQLHNFLSHTIFENYSAAAVALVNLHLHFAWLLWHLVTSIFDLATSSFVSHDRRGNRGHPPSAFCVAAAALMASGWLLWQHLGRFGHRGAPQHCVAGVTLGNIFHFGLRGRRGIWGFAGTWRSLPWFCVTGVALAWSQPHSFCVAAVALMARASSGGVLGHDWSPIMLVNIV